MFDTRVMVPSNIKEQSGIKKYRLFAFGICCLLAYMSAMASNQMLNILCIAIIAVLVLLGDDGENFSVLIALQLLDAGVFFKDCVNLQIGVK